MTFLLARSVGIVYTVIDSLQWHRLILEKLNFCGRSLFGIISDGMRTFRFYSLAYTVVTVSSCAKYYLRIEQMYSVYTLFDEQDLALDEGLHSVLYIYT